MVRTCKVCGRELPLELFSKGRFGMNHVCKECVSQIRKKNKLKRTNEEIMRKEQVQKQLEKNHEALACYTPRDLLNELALRGYEGELQHVEVHKIKVTAYKALL